MQYFSGCVCIAYSDPYATSNAHAETDANTYRDSAPACHSDSTGRSNGYR